MDIQSIRQTILEILGPNGRCITQSKPQYKAKHPKNLVVFNANICLDGKKVWYGDIDITISRDELIKLAEAFGKEIYVLHEMDARFENEKAPLLDRFVYRVSPDKSETIGEALSKIYQITEAEIAEA